MGKFTPSRTHINKQAYNKGADLVVSSGAITVTHSYHRISGEGDSADDLTKIYGPAVGGDIGQILILTKTPGLAQVNILDNASGSNANNDINCTGNRLIQNDKDAIVLMWTGSLWIELSFANNA